jgi:hypothetical protein
VPGIQPDKIGVAAPLRQAGVDLSFFAAIGESARFVSAGGARARVVSGGLGPAEQDLRIRLLVGQPLVAVQAAGNGNQAAARDRGAAAGGDLSVSDTRDREDDEERCLAAQSGRRPVWARPPGSGDRFRSRIQKRFKLVSRMINS